MTLAPGGVGRNIAETLARLGAETRLLSAVGDDHFGAIVLEETRSAGVLVDGVIRTAGRTGVYLSAADAEGALATAISDMDICELITPAYLASREETLSASAFIIADTNIPAESLSFLSRLAAARSIPFLIEPVSVQKGRKILSVDGPIRYITPNLGELRGLTGVPAALGRTGCADGPDEAGPPGIPESVGGRYLAVMRERLPLVGSAIVTMGSAGSVLMDAKTGSIIRIPSIPVTVADPNGAGDAFVAGFVAGLINGLPAEEAMRYGSAAASITLASPDSVAADISIDRVRRMAGK